MSQNKFKDTIDSITVNDEARDRMLNNIYAKADGSTVATKRKPGLGWLKVLTPIMAVTLAALVIVPNFTNKQAADSATPIETVDLHPKAENSNQTGALSPAQEPDLEVVCPLGYSEMLDFIHENGTDITEETLNGQTTVYFNLNDHRYALAPVTVQTVQTTGNASANVSEELNAIPVVDGESYWLITSSDDDGAAALEALLEGLYSGFEP